MRSAAAKLRRKVSAVRAEIALIESQLSPENLHQDGERSPESARKIGQRLEMRRVELTAELVTAIPDESESQNMYA